MQTGKPELSAQESIVARGGKVKRTNSAEQERPYLVASQAKTARRRREGLPQNALERIYRSDILREAWRRVRSSRGARE